MKHSKLTYFGHNPLVSVIMLYIMITALVSALSGMLIFISGDTGILEFRFNPGFDKNVVCSTIGCFLLGLLVSASSVRGEGKHGTSQ